MQTCYHGTNTYTWDARNHLVGIAGGNTASFVYDADGRRTLKSINGTSTQFLYDGLNPVQELQNNAVSAPSCWRVSIIDLHEASVSLD